MRKHAGWIAPVFLLALVGPEARADDEEPAPLTATLDAVEGNVATTFDVTSAFTEAFRRRLASGLTSRAVIEISLIDRSERPVAYALRECQLRFDIWDEILDVLIRDAGRAPRRARQAVIDEALRACGKIDRLTIGDLSGLTYASGYRLTVAVSLNPVSEELLQHTREFMANPRGTRSGRPQSFFGTVARLFSSKQNVGGERFQFRSGVLARPRGGEL